uniref:Guanylate kinase-like domain-containing protein n=1 Tax=Bursaphelenchus xylophilus TaxID=6326 RepID=A0A1I7SJ87_BURXY
MVFSATLAAGFVMTTKIRPIVLTGPSGTGKSTLLNRAMKEYPDAFAFTVSHTTRKPRDGELHGVNYYFVERSEMEKMIDNGEFVENVEFGGNRYGTSKMAIENVQKSGKICILDLELNGVRSLKDHEMKFKFILIRAPSYEVLVSLREFLWVLQGGLMVFWKKRTLF